MTDFVSEKTPSETTKQSTVSVEPSIAFPSPKISYPFGGSDSFPAAITMTTLLLSVKLSGVLFAECPKL